MRGTDCHTDHLLIRSKLALLTEPMHRKRAPKPRKRLNIEALRDEEVTAKLQSAIAQNFEETEITLQSSEQHWQEFSSKTFSAAESTLGYSKKKNPVWFDENAHIIHPLIDAKNLAHANTLQNKSPENQLALRKARRDLKNCTGNVKNDWLRSKSIAIQEFADTRDAKNFYAINSLYGPRRSNATALKSKDF